MKLITEDRTVVLFLTVLLIVFSFAVFFVVIVPQEQSEVLQDQLCQRHGMWLDKSPGFTQHCIDYKGEFHDFKYEQ